jgi:hypothetical protein
VICKRLHAAEFPLHIHSTSSPPCQVFVEGDVRHVSAVSRPPPHPPPGPQRSSFWKRAFSISHARPRTQLLKYDWTLQSILGFRTRRSFVQALCRCAMVIDKEDSPRNRLLPAQRPQLPHRQRAHLRKPAADTATSPYAGIPATFAPFTNKSPLYIPPFELSNSRHCELYAVIAIIIVYAMRRSATKIVHWNPAPKNDIKCLYHRPRQMSEHLTAIHNTLQ